LIALFWVYLTTALVGLRLDAISGFATLVWFPTGIAIAVLVLSGYRFWPAVTLGAFLANWVNGASIPVALGISFGNTLEAIVAVYLFRDVLHLRPALSGLTDVLMFIFVIIPVSTVISASIGVFSLWRGGVLTGYQEVTQTWAVWWIGDFLSALVISPVILTHKNGPTGSFSWKRRLEIIILAILICILGFTIFLSLFGLGVQNPSLTYLVFPPIIWISLRFGLAEITQVTFAFSALAVLGAIFGIGPFAPGDLSSNLLLLNSFIGIIATTSLLLSSVIQERRELELKKDDFLSMASHELKTPLTSLKLFTEILSRKFKKERDRESIEYLQRMEEQIDRVTHLINDLLRLAKIQSPNPQSAKETFPLDSLIFQIIQTMQVVAPEYRFINKGKVRHLIYGDREQLEQVLFNLISNAVKYSVQNKKIVITTKKDNKRIIISVKDFGIGISEKEKGRVFERFYRTSAGSFLASGLGIGLYMSKDIVESHKGDIWFESKEGKGSTFHVSLPAVTASIK
jgi:signal transduction histidine kinase